MESFSPFPPALLTFPFQSIPKTAFFKFLRLSGLYCGSCVTCRILMGYLISLDSSFPICKMGSWASTCCRGRLRNRVAASLREEAAAVPWSSATEGHEYWHLGVCGTSQSSHPNGSNVSQTVCFTFQVHVNFYIVLFHDIALFYPICSNVLNCLLVKLLNFLLPLIFLK